MQTFALNALAEAFEVDRSVALPAASACIEAALVGQNFGTASNVRERKCETPNGSWPHWREVLSITEPLTIDRPPVGRAKPASVVSASALAVHLDCSRAYLHKLEADGVIQRQGDGFPLDQRRIAYLRYLRRERKQSPRSEADAAFAAAKTRLVMLRVQERERTMIPMAEV
ncbi:MAG TPA: hypothetical protein VIJ35_04910, partial [Bradyrhizobium sp.]